MKFSEIAKALEAYAPLYLQDDYDNSGVQVGAPDSETDSVLICLDITEDIIDEAIAKGCKLIVSHHPLIFKALRQVSGVSYQQRCVMKALANGICLYSAHTNLDNVPGGVNWKIAELLGIHNLEWLEPKEGTNAGSGVVGSLSEETDAESFLKTVKERFGVECLMHSECSGSKLRRIAICGGAGAFLMKNAIAKGADCFVCGEFHYHDYFENDGMVLAELGHYQSEQFTKDLLRDIISAACPELRIEMTEINTNPIKYETR